MTSLAPAVRAPGRRFALPFIGALLLIAGLAAVLGSPPAVRAADHAVQISDSAFGPSTLTISVGDTVTWTNAGAAPHTVTSETDAFDSGNMDPGQVFSFTFTEPGTYSYDCEYHSNMVGTIVVEAAAADPTAAPAAPTASAAPAVAPPNTALPAPADAAPIAPLLIGLGLLALALGLVPGREATVSGARSGGWRR